MNGDGATADGRPFRMTADAYARYRPTYPPDVLRGIAQRCGLTLESAVLDYGCGPGTLALAVAQTVGSVVAVDPEPSMVEVGRLIARSGGVENIAWLAGTLDALAPSARFDVTVFGQSLHWTPDPVGLLRELRRRARADDHVVIVCEIADKRQGPGPKPADVVKLIAQSYVGPLVAPPPLLPLGDWRPSLDAAGWSCAAHDTWPVSRAENWDAEHVIGNLYVSALGLFEALGDRRADFERYAATALADHRPRQPLTLTLTSTYHIWWGLAR